ncbi:hypothetical protein BZG36_03488 [Bifiguratus adelaidae]|uniref:Scamp-domain-containing protein n=1 Tax=Bifiguratus adelaidae TaxID=1938954 RepID=A0A261XWR1_9FUNG|nr:hypothetical protein BZG36_03488 [Bifiguratus adelaidae]
MSQNPFSDPENPFQDPSITSALQSHHRTEPAYQYDDADEHEHFTSITQLDDYSPAKPAADLSTPSENAQKLGQNGFSFGSDSREAELERRERELEERERALRDRQQDLNRSGVRKANNFPPFFPLIFMDISFEIPLEHQKTVTWIFRSWLAFIATLAMNFVACLILLFSHPPSVTSAPADFGVALTTLFTHSLLSFFLWYRPVYNAYMKEVSLYYYFYFVFGGIQCLYLIYMALGIPNTGGAGLILLVTLFSDGWILSGVFTLISTLLWLGTAGLHCYCFKKTYDQYKNAGHTFTEAKRDAYSHMARGGAHAAAAGYV